MFLPAAERWDVCSVEDVTLELGESKKRAVLLCPVDRVHPYPYLSPAYSKPRDWVTLDSRRVEPFGTRTRALPPRAPPSARAYDFRDARHAHGIRHIAALTPN